MRLITLCVSLIGMIGGVLMFSSTLRAPAETGQAAERLGQFASDQAVWLLQGPGTGNSRAMKQHLPKSGDGWTRRSFARGENRGLLLTSVDPGLASQEASARMTLKFGYFDRFGWVYEKGPHIVAINVRPVRRTQEAHETTLVALTGQPTHDLDADIQQSDRGWAVIGGVPFSRRDFPSSAGRRVRGFIGRLGDSHGVRIDVRALAPDIAVRELLERIDFDGLNAFLDPVLPHVGSNARPIEIGEQASVAQDDLNHRLRRRLSNNPDGALQTQRPGSSRKSICRMDGAIKRCIVD
ncbi:MAG: hypothetical protein AAFY74_18090 [Pseudomonadota bacterium]